MMCIKITTEWLSGRQIQLVSATKSIARQKTVPHDFRKRSIGEKTVKSWTSKLVRAATAIG